MAKRMKRTPTAIYDMARIALIAIIIATALNMVMDILGSDTFYVDSLMLPYSLFWVTTGGSIVAVLILGVYLVCYFLSKKNGAWMVSALVLFSIDCVWLIISIVSGISDHGAGVTMLIFALPIVFHVLVLIALIAGVKNRKEATTSFEEKLKMLGSQPQAPAYQVPPYQAPLDQAPNYQAPDYQAPVNQAPPYPVEDSAPQNEE